MVAYFPNCAADQSKLHQSGKKVLPGLFLWICIGCMENVERRYYGCRLLRSWKNETRQKSTLEDSKQKKCSRHETVIFLHNQRGSSKIVWKRPWSLGTHSKAETTCKERRSQIRTSRQLGFFSTNRSTR